MKTSTVILGLGALGALGLYLKGKSAVGDMCAAGSQQAGGVTKFLIDAGKNGLDIAMSVNNGQTCSQAIFDTMSTMRIIQAGWTSLSRPLVPADIM
jgi:hypothetical protein